MRGLCVSVLMLLTACGGDSRESDASTAQDGGLDAAPVPGDADGQEAGSDAGSAEDAGSKLAACRTYYQAICDRAVACGLSRPSDCWRPEACPDLLFSTGSTWTVDDAKSCAASWSQFSCTDLEQRRHPACAQRAGTLADGKPCIDESQCQSVRCGTDVRHTRCGGCMREVERDGLCGTGFTTCPRDQYCANGRCVDWPMRKVDVAAGGACGATATEGLCGQGLGCRATPDAGVGTCVALPEMGKPCVPTFGSIGLCAAEATCNGRPTGTCVALGKIGEPCGFTSCVEGAYCNIWVGGTGPSHTCLPNLSAGTACRRLHPAFTRERGDQMPCAFELECMNREDQFLNPICARSRELGESCDDQNICRSGSSCLNGTCVASEDRGLYTRFCKDRGI